MPISKQSCQNIIIIAISLLVVLIIYSKIEDTELIAFILFWGIAAFILA